MVRWLRIAAALVLWLALLEAANRAVRDCPTGSGAVENCLWIHVRQRLGLPASRLLRVGLLELVGLAILAGLFVVFRYVWPHRIGGLGQPSVEAYCGQTRG